MNLAEWIAEGWKEDLEGMCRGCGKVAINNANDELCAECYQDLLANQADKWGEQIEVEALSNN
jgi:ribosomal protein L37E